MWEGKTVGNVLVLVLVPVLVLALVLVLVMALVLVVMSHEVHTGGHEGPYDSSLIRRNRRSKLSHKRYAIAVASRIPIHHSLFLGPSDAAHSRPPSSPLPALYLLSARGQQWRLS
jgi:hypothetical protein